MPKIDIPIETLIANLHGKDWEKRCDAARLLGQSRDPRAVEVLLPDLQNPDWRVRRNAAQALGALKAPRAVEPLLKALKDRTATVRERAAVALGRIKDPQTIPHLIEAVVESNGHVNEGAFRAVRKFGCKAGSHLVEALAKKPNIYLVELLGESKNEVQAELLISLAGSPDSAMRQKALMALGKTDDPRTVDFLLDTLEHGDIETQTLVVQSLVQLRAAQALPKFLDLLGIDHLYSPRAGLYRAITEAFETLAGIRKEVENAFPGKFPIRFGTSGASASLPQMMGLLGDENYRKLNQMLADAERRAHDLGKTHKVPSEIIVHFAEQTWKLGAMFADARDARAEQVRVLIGLLNSEAPLKRAAAALALPWYFDAGASEPLAQAMQDEEEIVRRAAAWAHAALKNSL